MKRIYNDSAKYPIIAFDFDDTINVNGGDKFPKCGEVRKYAKEVINFLHDIGCKIVIWTSRDVAYNQEERRMYDHLTPMLHFLDDNGIKYDAINKSVQFAPYHYNGRKVYAHLYVDDRAYGWSDCDHIMILVLEHILCNIIGMVDAKYLNSIEQSIACECQIPKHIVDYIKQMVENWRVDDE